MPKQVVFAALIEAALFALAAILWAQPRSVFEGQSERLRSFARGGGILLACVLFCWSVVLGSVLFMNQYSLPLWMRR